jgi:four helix bundle protein
MRPEQMRVYQVVAELGRLVDQLLSEPLPKRARYVAGHIRRSLESAGLNLNEGLTEFAPKVKASAFGISRKELGELKKGLARFHDMKVGQPILLRKGAQLADCAIGMLTVMIKQQEARND